MHNRVKYSTFTVLVVYSNSCHKNLPYPPSVLEKYISEGDGWLSWYTRPLATAALVRVKAFLKNQKWAT
jgi:hypothetical protein